VSGPSESLIKIYYLLIAYLKQTNSLFWIVLFFDSVFFLNVFNEQAGVMHLCQPLEYGPWSLKSEPVNWEEAILS
jgi:hypothetical protein